MIVLAFFLFLIFAGLKAYKVVDWPWWYSSALLVLVFLAKPLLLPLLLIAAAGVYMVLDAPNRARVRSAVRRVTRR